MELKGTVNNQTCYIISVPAAHHYFINKSMSMLHNRVWSSLHCTRSCHTRHSLTGGY